MLNSWIRIVPKFRFRLYVVICIHLVGCKMASSVEGKQQIKIRCISNRITKKTKKDKKILQKLKGPLQTAEVDLLWIASALFHLNVSSSVFICMSVCIYVCVYVHVNMCVYGW